MSCSLGVLLLYMLYLAGLRYCTCWNYLNCVIVSAYLNDPLAGLFLYLLYLSEQVAGLCYCTVLLYLAEPLAGLSYTVPAILF
jgi:hypothetical protein